MEDESVWRDVRVKKPFKYRWWYSLYLLYVKTGSSYMNPAIGDGLVWVSCQGGKIANKCHMLQCEVEVINI